VAFGIRVPEVSRENRSRRNLHGNEEEGKKEETLTDCLRNDTRKSQNFTRLSGEAPLERHFRFAR
jgi:hypothetical protein